MKKFINDSPIIDINVNEKNNAGEFSEWLHGFIETMKGEADGDVPCGDCVACCTSSKFIHVRPDDSSALNHIPQELLFPAPGLPRGHLLMGYDEDGLCPMFQAGRCSIYDYRPYTCRQYDCRVFAATGISAEKEGSDIAQRVASWAFQFSRPESEALYLSVRVAAKFIHDHASQLPAEMIPLTPAQQSVMAIRIHELFINETVDSIRDKTKSLIDSVRNTYQK